MSAEASRGLLDLGPVDRYRSERTFGGYLGGGVKFYDSQRVLRFDLGWAKWRFPMMMHLIAAMKDVEGTDTLVHHQPTFDAWYETGTFFVESGKWAYVGAGPMFDVATGSYDRPAHVGAEHPSLEHVREWHHAGPLAKSVGLSSDGVWLEVETVRHGKFRCGIWTLPRSTRWTDDALATGLIDDGGARLSFTCDGRELWVTVRDLFDAREL